MTATALQEIVNHISNGLNKKKPVDIQILDYKQCFDTLWLQECLNDLYDSGVNDDKLALLYNVNSNVKVAVKTPVGKTERNLLPLAVTEGLYI